jgi:hypothetical protein
MDANILTTLNASLDELEKKEVLTQAFTKKIKEEMKNCQSIDDLIKKIIPPSQGDTTELRGAGKTIMIIIIIIALLGQHIPMQ